MDPTQTPDKQNPERLIEAVHYLKMLTDDEGKTKWPEYSANAKLGYVVAFIKREIKLLRNTEGKRKKMESLRDGGVRVVKREEM